MTIRETMKAVLSYLCEQEKGKDYAPGKYSASKVAEDLGKSSNAVLRALELAEQEHYIRVHRQGRSPGGEVHVVVDFSLNAMAFDYCET